MVDQANPRREDCVQVTDCQRVEEQIVGLAVVARELKVVKKTTMCTAGMMDLSLSMVAKAEKTVLIALSTVQASWRRGG